MILLMILLMILSMSLSMILSMILSLILSLILVPPGLAPQPLARCGLRRAVLFAAANMSGLSTTR